MAGEKRVSIEKDWKVGDTAFVIPRKYPTNDRCFIEVTIDVDLGNGLYFVKQIVGDRVRRFAAHGLFSEEEMVAERLKGECVRRQENQ